MAKKEKFPVTPAIRVLRDAGVIYTPHLYDYVDKGGTRRVSEVFGAEEHQVVKTLIMETESRKPLVVLMHGDLSVGVGLLAKAAGVKKVVPCQPETAEKLTGYKTGGISPLGTRKSLPVYMEASILALDTVFINGGKRGFMVAISPSDLVRILSPGLVSVGVKEG